MSNFNAAGAVAVGGSGSSSFSGSGAGSMSAFDCIDQKDIRALRTFCYLAMKNQNQNLEIVDRFGNTPLLKACYLGQNEFAEVLLHFGANIKAINYLGQNALTLATYAGNLDLVRKLLLHRSYEDFNAASIMPALCVATLRQNQQLIQYFRTLDINKAHTSNDVIETAHGLTPEDLEAMIKTMETL